MKSVVDSMIAMAAGWLAMMIEIVLVSVLSGDGLLMLGFFGVYSAVVVALCWQPGYLPLYAVLACSGKWMDWRIWTFIGLSVGGMVPFGIMMISSVVARGDFSWVCSAFFRRPLGQWRRWWAAGFSTGGLRPGGRGSGDPPGPARGWLSGRSAG